MLSTLKRVCFSKWRSHILPTWHRITEMAHLDLHFDLTGKLYCKLHFDQRNNGTSIRRTFSLPSVRPVRIYPPSSDNDGCKVSNFSSHHLLLRIVIAFRSTVLLMKISPPPAVRQTCRVNPQQVPSARSWGNSWAGLWVWLVLCATPPGICPSARVMRHRPLPATWETTHRTTRCCMSYWAWACHCCLFYKKYCCRCTQRLCLMGRAL